MAEVVGEDTEDTKDEKVTVLVDAVEVVLGVEVEVERMVVVVKDGWVEVEDEVVDGVTVVVERIDGVSTVVGVADDELGVVTVLAAGLESSGVVVASANKK